MEEGAAAKAIVLPLTRPSGGMGTDELNLAEFPLAVLSKSNTGSVRTLVFEDDIFDEGTKQRVRRKLIVSGSDAFGLPTPADSDVLLVLMWLTNARNQFTESKVGFTRYEMVQRLGWDQGGKSYRRIDEALQRWASVTLHYNRAWWSKKHQNWRSQTFHVLESLDLRGRTVAGVSDDDGQSTFTWNPVLFESFRACNLKRLDLNEYFRLRLPTAKQAYRFLDKRFYRSRQFEMDLRVFACEHVGLARSYDIAQLRRKLAPALSELENIGFLKKEEDVDRYQQIRRGEWRVRLYRGSQEAGECPLPKMDGIAGELITRGVTREAAEQLAASHEEIAIRAAIEYFDWLVGKCDQRVAINPAGFLVNSIRKDYRPSRDFRATKEKSGSKSVTRQTIPKALAPIDEFQWVRVHCQSLSQSELVVLEQEAISAALPFQRSMWERLSSQRHVLAESLRWAMIASLLKSRGVVADAV